MHYTTLTHIKERPQLHTGLLFLVQESQQGVGIFHQEALRLEETCLKTLVP